MLESHLGLDEESLQVVESIVRDRQLSDDDVQDGIESLLSRLGVEYSRSDVGELMREFSENSLSEMSKDELSLV